jgi:hypothetical protein
MGAVRRMAETTFRSPALNSAVACANRATLCILPFGHADPHKSLDGEWPIVPSPAGRGSKAAPVDRAERACAWGCWTGEWRSSRGLGGCAGSAERRRRRGRQQLESIPVGRAASDEEVAALIAFLCFPAAADMTGQSINIDGGMVMW